MLSARSLFGEIYDNDEAFRLLCSLAAAGEEQGGWENARLALLAEDRDLAPKIARHGADEARHGRIFTSLLRRRGLEPRPVPPEMDYVGQLERAGVGVPHARLRGSEPLGTADVIAYLAHGRVTEQRGAEQMGAMLRAAGHHHHADVARALKVVARDEDLHLAHCHEELLRLAGAGHRARVRDALRRAARTEIRIHHDVSVAVMRAVARALGWSPVKEGALVAGVRTLYAAERAGGWRRLTVLRMPAVRNALGAAAPAPDPTFDAV